MKAFIYRRLDYPLGFKIGFSGLKLFMYFFYKFLGFSMLFLQFFKFFYILSIKFLAYIYAFYKFLGTFYIKKTRIGKK